ncbi:MAG: hypothetical protein AAFQ87_21815, partial [Bacteroidota bacterium]
GTVTTIPLLEGYSTSGLLVISTKAEKSKRSIVARSGPLEIPDNLPSVVFRDDVPALYLHLQLV